jgi:repressor LexA
VKNMTVGEKIKNLRISLDLTQEALATAASTTKQTIHKYETGIISNIPASKLKAIADKLHTTPAYLMGWIDNSESQKKNDAITDIILRLRSDEAFLDIVKTISFLDQDQLTAVRSLLTAFKK